MKAALHSQISNNNERKKVAFSHFSLFRCDEWFAFNPFPEFNLKSNFSFSFYAVMSRYTTLPFKSFEQFAITTSVRAQRCVRKRNSFLAFIRTFDRRDQDVSFASTKFPRKMPE